MKRTSLLGFIIFFTQGLLCSAATPGVTDTEIIIGGHTLESGAFAAFAVAPKAATAYFDQLNEKGGVNGRKIKYIRVDTQGVQIKSIQASKKLVEEDNIFAMFAAVGPSHQAVYKYLIEKGVPDVLFADQIAEYGQPFKKLIFPGKPSFESEVQALVEVAVAKHKGAKVCFLTGDNPFGEDFLANAKKGIEEANAKFAEKDKFKIVAAEKINPTAVQANSQVLTFKRASCDLVFTSAMGALAPSAISYGALQDFHPVWFTASGNSNHQFLELLPKEHRDGVISLTSVSIEGWGAPGWDAYKALMEKTNTVVSKTSATGYVMAEIFAEAVKRAGKDLTRDNFVKAFESLNGWKCSMCIEPLDYSPTNHWGFGKPTVVISKGGKWVKF